ncbi:MAG: hypothetical protein O2894_10085 [Planctomycetota bacterium]|nr:hypothetical protein [Planctomycetota bacterium]
MLHFRRFCADALAPAPARDAYIKRGGGRGWPEQCPPVRASNAYGFDVLASVDIEFRREAAGGWSLTRTDALTADWGWVPEDAPPDAEAAPPQVQEAAWFWDENQVLPHPIAPEVWPLLRDQVKVSTFLYLTTDPGEMVLFTDLPHAARAFRVLPALVETDTYPASYPWHCVLELDRRHEHVRIARGEPLCRLLPVRRAEFVAREMDDDAFGAFFDRGQAWLATHGKGPPGPMMDITGAYGRLQGRAKFRVESCPDPE